MKKIVRSGYYSKENLSGFFSYRSPEDKITLGFMICQVRSLSSSGLTAEVSAQIASDICDLVSAWAEGTGNSHKISEIDFDLCDQAKITLNLTGDTQRRIMGNSVFMMLPDFRNLGNTIETLIKATKAGEIPEINVDVVADKDGELQLLDWFEEITGDMS